MTLKTSQDGLGNQHVKKAVFQDVLYEFVIKPHSLGQASEDCSARGGKLLNYLDCEIKNFFSELFKEHGSAAPGWWIDGGLTGSYDECVDITGE